MKLLEWLYEYFHTNCHHLLEGRDMVLKRREQALIWMAEDFQRMCPETKSFAVTPHALVMRYEGYAMQGRRPQTPACRHVKCEHVQQNCACYLSFVEAVD